MDDPDRPGQKKRTTLFPIQNSISKMPEQIPLTISARNCK